MRNHKAIKQAAEIIREWSEWMANRMPEGSDRRTEWEERNERLQLGLRYWYFVIAHKEGFDVLGEATEQELANGKTVRDFMHGLDGTEGTEAGLQN